jgi:hypothetical protein
MVGVRTKNDCPSIKRVEIRPIVPRYVTAASSRDAEYAREKEVKGRTRLKRHNSRPLPGHPFSVFFPL